MPLVERVTRGQEIFITPLPLGLNYLRMLGQEEGEAFVMLRSPRGELQVFHAESLIGELYEQLMAGIRRRRGFRRGFPLFTLTSDF